MDTRAAIGAACFFSRTRMRATYHYIKVATLLQNSTSQIRYHRRFHLEPLVIVDITAVISVGAYQRHD